MAKRDIDRMTSWWTKRMRVVLDAWIQWRQEKETAEALKPQVDVLYTRYDAAVHIAAEWEREILETDMQIKKQEEKDGNERKAFEHLAKTIEFEGKQHAKGRYYQCKSAKERVDKRRAQPRCQGAKAARHHSGHP